MKSTDSQSEAQSPEWRKSLLCLLDNSAESNRGFDSGDKKFTAFRDGVGDYVCMIRTRPEGIYSFSVDEKGKYTGYFQIDAIDNEKTIIVSNPALLESKSHVFDNVLATYEVEMRRFFSKQKNTQENQTPSQTQRDFEKKVLNTIEETDARTVAFLTHQYLMKPLTSAGFRVGDIRDDNGTYSFKVIGENAHEIVITNRNSRFGKKTLLIQYVNEDGNRELTKIQKAMNASGKIHLGEKIASTLRHDFYSLNITLPETIPDDIADPLTWVTDIHQ